ncbi:hypothetical protein JMJ35_001841 [Cladonia borealis]|uniref:Uncharacterized protein n=1 Tax=Cladonia borealis TaxID=184061 RepID=A0AA39R6J1_9LECA|nr:hypothetical protein JMJ35_001841 [Cladonia borealis]
MANLTNLTSFNPPIPIPPIAPNFAFCDRAYGVGLSQGDAIFLADTLPHGTFPVPYTVNQDLSSPDSYDLPYETHRRDVAITITVAGVADVDSILLVPNEIRGMAAYIVQNCLEQGRGGGFITKGIQGLVDYVTDPTSDLDAHPYPSSTAFITVLLGQPDTAFSSPGDYDPSLAYFLLHTELVAMDMVEPQYLDIIGERMLQYTAQAARMTRLGNVAWWDTPEVGSNETEAAPLRMTNAAMHNVSTSRRRSRDRSRLVY